MKKAVLVLFILLAVYFLFFYRSNMQICPEDTTCTRDIKPMCNHETKGYKTLSSTCSCGLDADVLEQRGWVYCPEELRKYPINKTPTPQGQ